MKNLLIDIGNSSIKSAISKGNKLYNIKRKNYIKDNLPSAFKNILSYKRTDFDSVGISCLNKKNRSILNNIIKQKYSVKPLFIGIDNNLPIKINYEKSLGNDRICSAVAACMKYKEKKNILVIDFGTATTYNLISNKIFLGGLIMPGILTSLEVLKFKANLPLTDIKNVDKLINNKTKNNILSGVIHQSLFTTDSIIKEIEKKYNNLFVINTGGFAELISKKSCLIDRIEKNLVLEGINFILNHNQIQN
jgi:type III pantothenate kinase